MQGLVRTFQTHMSFLFGGERPQGNQCMKMYSREVTRHVRSIDREICKMKASERQTQAEIRRAAEGNDISLAKIKAKELIRNRMYTRRLTATKEGLSCLAQELNIIHSAQKSQEVIQKTTKILQTLNNKMDLTQTYKMLMEFEKQNTNMSDKQAMVNETIDGMFEVDGAEIEGEMTAVFEELGLRMHSDWGGLNAERFEASSHADMDTLEDRFMKLKKQTQN